MSAVSHNGRSDPGGVGDLREEIAAKRAELAETVEALAAKADVKARTREQVEAAKVRAREGVRQAVDTTADTGRRLYRDPVGQLLTGATRVRRSVREHPAPWVVAAGALALVLVVLPRRWRR